MKIVITTSQKILQHLHQKHDFKEAVHSKTVIWLLFIHLILVGPIVCGVLC